MMNIWFATGNEHKANELRAILDIPDLVIKIPRDDGILFDPEENGATFFENSFIKARELYKLVHSPVIADDSGLVVDALDGRPGIFSARYGSEGGRKLDDRARNALLLKEIGDNPDRKARFVCSMVLMLGENRFFSAQDILEGEIIKEERGEGGFGYDPILFIAEKNRTAAELTDVEKNIISHRGKAARSIAAIIRACQKAGEL
jgi:XTP/dITP diphosphohydrolase